MLARSPPIAAVNFMDNDIQPCEELKNLWCDWSGTTHANPRAAQPKSGLQFRKINFVAKAYSTASIPDGTWPRFFTSIARCPTD